MKTTKIDGDKIVEGDYTVEGHLEVTGSIRVTRFLKVLGFIFSGESIKAGWGIEAGEDIKAGEDFGIYAGLSLKISQKYQHAVVSAKTQPANIQLGTFKKSVDYGWAWHVHHEVLAERLTESVENRIAYIKSGKPEEEVETRLKLLKPMVGTFKTKTELNALHEQECPHCPWNGTTIFP